MMRSGKTNVREIGTPHHSALYHGFRIKEYECLYHSDDNHRHIDSGRQLNWSKGMWLTTYIWPSETHAIERMSAART